MVKNELQDYLDSILQQKVDYITPENIEEDIQINEEQLRKVNSFLEKKQKFLA